MASTFLAKHKTSQNQQKDMTWVEQDLQLTRCPAPEITVERLVTSKKYKSLLFHTTFQTKKR